jgi:hypothetical protein
MWYFEIVRMMFDWRIIETDGLFIRNNWCYETPDDAEAALKDKEDGAEPEGWYRHIETGRRRLGGDPATEHIQP